MDIVAATRGALVELVYSRYDITTHHSLAHIDATEKTSGYPVDSVYSLYMNNYSSLTQC
jgi:hypothetical protein